MTSRGLPDLCGRGSTIRGEGVGPGLVYFHGGGFVAGDLDTHDALCRSLAVGAGCRVVSVDYRLAPEHRFPAAVDDAVAATADVRNRARDLAIDPDRLAVGGDSAGGTLATLTAAALGARVALQLLLCPVLDAEPRTASRQVFRAGYLLDAAMMARDLGDYAPAGPDPADPRLSPLRAAALAGMPRALIHTAEFDPLRDEGALYAERLAAEGVSVAHRCHAGMIHPLLRPDGTGARRPDRAGGDRLRSRRRPGGVRRAGTAGVSPALSRTAPAPAGWKPAVPECHQIRKAPLVIRSWQRRVERHIGAGGAVVDIEGGRHRGGGRSRRGPAAPCGA